MMSVVPSNGMTKSVPNDHLYDSDGSLPDIECDLCHKEFNSVKAYEQHLLSKKHHQMLSNEKAKEKMATRNGSVPSEDDDDEEEELACKICSKTFSGYIPFANHMKGNTHSKNLKKEKLKDEMKDLPEVLKNGDSDDDEILRKPYALCTPCKKTFYDPNSYALHLKGSQHERKMKCQKAFESLNIEDEDKDSHKCDVCRKEFTGPVPYKVHLHSACHQKEVERSRMEDQLKDSFTRDPETRRLVCKECKKGFTDVLALRGHLENNSHQKQKVKEEVFGFVTSHPEIVAVKAVQNSTDHDDGETSEGESNFHVGSYFLVCKLCRTSFSGPQSAKDHLASKKHVQAKSEREQRQARTENRAGDSKSADDSKVDEERDDQESRKSTETNDGFELV